jgi:hypothetical protein
VLGFFCGSKLGPSEGLVVGSREGFGLGCVDGINEGSLNGALVGCMVGTVLGDGDGVRHLLRPNVVDSEDPKSPPSLSRTSS